MEYKKQSREKNGMDTDIRAEKRKIRHSVLKIRDTIDQSEREKASLLLTEKILGHQWFYRSEYFLCFASYGSEIDTQELILEALRAGKRVYAPKVVQAQSTGFYREPFPERENLAFKMMVMRFFRIVGMEDLKKGYKGIPEPDESGEEYFYSEEAAERTLMLMPGVVFDRYRNRIGYGGGFYDRFLADKPLLQLRTIAVGYKCQLMDEVPAEKGDIRPYQVICV